MQTNLLIGRRESIGDCQRGFKKWIHKRQGGNVGCPETMSPVCFSRGKLTSQHFAKQSVQAVCPGAGWLKASMKTMLAIYRFSRKLLSRSTQNRLSLYIVRERERESRNLRPRWKLVFYNLTLEVTPNHFSCIIFIRNEPVSPAHTQGEGIREEHEYHTKRLRGPSYELPTTEALFRGTEGQLSMETYLG